MTRTRKVRSGAHGACLVALTVLLAGPPPVFAAGEPAPGAVSSTTVKLPDGPGSVRGLADSANVSVFSAQLSYSIPIDLPRGLAGLTPTLTLSYSGDLGNGPLGVGWTLPTASIRRSTRFGVPSFTGSDELELVGIAGGGRLVPLAGGGWALEGKSRAVKVEEIIEETEHGPQRAGFRVTENGGVTYELGVTASGRQASGDKVFAWFAETIKHPTNAKIVLSYSHDANEVYLSDIYWGPSNVYRAELQYSARPDVAIGYRSGFKVQTARRLSKVLVHSHNEVLRAYVLSYGTTAQDGEFGLSRLRQVTMFGRAEKGSLPALTFQYAPAVPPQVESMAGVDGWVLNDNGVSLADVNGDGMADLLRLGIEEDAYKLGNGSGFGTPKSFNGAANAWLEDARLLDVDGDTRPELVQYFNETLQVSELIGDTLGPSTPWAGGANRPLFGSDVVFADFNGDGRSDYLWGGSEGMSISFGADSGLGPLLDVPPIDGLYLQPGNDVRFFEVNGDGLVDAVELGGGWWRVYLGRGNGTFDFAGQHNYPWGDSTTLDDVRLADLNRDGLMDLVHIQSDYVHWYRGKAGGGVIDADVLVPRPGLDGFPTVISIADVNGNGSEDVVWSNVLGMWALDLAGPTSAGMLVGIDNGMGKTLSVEYDSSAKLAVAADSGGNPWQRLLPVSIPVPVGLQMDPGAGLPVRSVEYTVRDGFWDVGERRFGGFLVGGVRTLGTTAQDTLYEETQFLAGEGEDRQLRGLIAESRVENGAAQLYTRTVNTYETKGVDGLIAADSSQQRLLRVGALLTQRTFHHEGQSTPLQTLATYEYDGRVRAIEETHFGRLDLHGDEKFIQRTYSHDDALWVHDLVCEELLYGGTQVDVADQDPTFKADTDPTSHTRFVYGDSTSFLDWTDVTQCQVGRGLLRETRGWLDDPQNPRWVALKQTTYGTWDNVASSFEGGVRRNFAYETAGLFATSETVSPQQGSTLEWRVDVWDKVLGVPTNFTDASGAITSLGYDSLGRLTSTAVGSNDPHVRHVYDWQAPTPKTWTYAFDGTDGSQNGQWTGQWSSAGKWRESVKVTNGAGEALYSATRLAASQWIIAGHTSYDARGKVTEVADSYYATALPQYIAPATPRQTLTWDALGRLTSQTLPTLASKTLAYSAFGVVSTTQGLAPVASVTDGLGRILRTERTVGMVTESVGATYDPAGRITAMKINGGAVTHSFIYDTLGRLTDAEDPDIGSRTLAYNDYGQLKAHTNGAAQARTFSYDDAGRLTRTDGDGTSYVYHYDAAKAGSSGSFLEGRLAWVEEPRGEVHVSYDAYGRQVRQNRKIDSVWADETAVFSPSGLPLYGEMDGVRIDNAFDAAGRLVGVGKHSSSTNYWSATSLDAAGRVLAESYANGLTQTYLRDALGLPYRITVTRPSTGALYDVTLGRNAWGAPTWVQDNDQVGLNHSSTFAYDGAARLTDVVLGAVGQAPNLTANASSFTFTYRYDGLQNMTSRGVTGPQPLDVLTGTYKYAENNKGPRQLTSVVTASGIVPLGYDAAGRVTSQGGRLHIFNGLDQLIQVTVPGATGAPNKVVTHAYGFDGLRTVTEGDGASQYWFTSNLVERNGRREWYLKDGDRTLVRLNLDPVQPVASLSLDAKAQPAFASIDVASRSILDGAWIVAGLALIALALRRGRRTHGLGLTGAVLFAAVFAASCKTPTTQSPVKAQASRALWNVSDVIYYHGGVSAGPPLMTRQDGSVFEERRYEPFGIPVDGYRELAAGGPQFGGIDHAAEPLNALNKETDATTGYSYHGARWLAPQTATWVTPDPPVKAPDPKFLSEPWDLHPYQFVRQNPAIYWDPDGNHPLLILAVFLLLPMSDDVQGGSIAPVLAFPPAAAGFMVLRNAEGARDLHASVEAYRRGDDAEAIARSESAQLKFAEALGAGAPHLTTGTLPRSPVTKPQSASPAPTAAKVNPLKGTTYTGKVRAQMRPNLKTGRPDNHGFPLEVDNYAGLGRQITIKGGDGVSRTKIELDGSYNGKQGHFEWIVEPNGTVNHRQFVPNPGGTQ